MEHVDVRLARVEPARRRRTDPSSGATARHSDEETDVLPEHRDERVRKVGAKPAVNCEMMSNRAHCSIRSSPAGQRTWR